MLKQRIWVKIKCLYKIKAITEINIQHSGIITFLIIVVCLNSRNLELFLFYGCLTFIYRQDQECSLMLDIQFLN